MVRSKTKIKKRSFLERAKNLEQKVKIVITFRMNYVINDLY